MKTMGLQDFQELLEGSQILLEREVHVELSISVVAREGPNPNGEDALEKPFPEKEICLPRRDDPPVRAFDLAGELRD